MVRQQHSSMRADARANADRAWIERGHFSDPCNAWPIQLRLVEMKPRGYCNKRLGMRRPRRGRDVTVDGEDVAVEMHQVRYFLTLCQDLTFTRAAERCNVAQ